MAPLQFYLLRKVSFFACVFAPVSQRGTGRTIHSAAQCSHVEDVSPFTGHTDALDNGNTHHQKQKKKKQRRDSRKGEKSSTSASGKICAGVLSPQLMRTQLTTKAILSLFRRRWEWREINNQNVHG